MRAFDEWRDWHTASHWERHLAEAERELEDAQKRVRHCQEQLATCRRAEREELDSDGS